MLEAIGHIPRYTIENILYNVKRINPLFLLLAVVFWPLGLFILAVAISYGCKEAWYRGLAKNVKPFDERAKDAAEKGLLYLGEDVITDPKSDSGAPCHWDGNIALTGKPYARATPTSILAAGSPGKGKTVWGLSLLDQWARKVNSLGFVTSMKGDAPEELRAVEFIAKKHKKKLRILDLDCTYSHCWNPIEALVSTAEWGATAALELMRALSIGTGTDSSYYSQIAASLVQQVWERSPEATTFARILAILDDPDDKQLYPDMRRWQETEGLRAVFRQFAEVPQLNVSVFDPDLPDDVRENLIDFVKLAQEGNAIVYVRMKRMENLCPVMVRAFYTALSRVNENRTKDEACQGILIADELHKALPYCPSIFGELVAVSRSASLVPVFLLQNLSQVPPELLGEFLDIPMWVYFGSKDDTTKNIFRGDWSRIEIFKEFDKPTAISSWQVINEDLLKWLAVAENTSQVFLVRGSAEGDRGNPYFIGKAVPPTTIEEYHSFRELGWPKKGEFAGMVCGEKPKLGEAKPKVVTKPPKTSRIAAALGNLTGKGA